MRVPNHIAIILDGNGRWAKKACLWRNFVKHAGIGGGTVDCTGYIFP